MSTALDVDVSILKEKRWLSGREAVIRLNFMPAYSRSAPWCTLEAECSANSCAVVLIPDVRGSLISFSKERVV